MSWFGGALGAKRLELLRDLVPTTNMIALLVNPHYSEAETHVKEVKEARLQSGSKFSF